MTEKYMCKWCCANLTNTTYNPGMIPTTMDCRQCEECGGNCISGTHMTTCKY